MRRPWLALAAFLIAVPASAQEPDPPAYDIVIRNGRKRIEGHELFGDPEGLLFELRSDPAERINLRASRPDEDAALAAHAERYARSLRLHAPVHPDTGRPLPASHEELRARLGLTEREEAAIRELGYAE